jgi:hypothetical protein
LSDLRNPIAGKDVPGHLVSLWDPSIIFGIENDPGQIDVSRSYLKEVNKLVDKAADSDYDPVLVVSNQMMQSIVIGEAARVE